MWENFDVEDDFKDTPLPEGYLPIPVQSNPPDDNFLF